MNSLVLIPWAQTAWSEAGRIAGRIPLPLTEGGQHQAQAWADRLAPSGISVVYSSNERTSLETARILADRCGARRKIVEDLVEVNAGLWDGLTAEALKRRYPKVFKRWYDDPSSVCPPEGEDVTDAFLRLDESLERITRRRGDWNAAVVLGPLAFAVARCVVESVELTEVRAKMFDQPLRYAVLGETREAQPVMEPDPTGDGGAGELAGSAERG